MSAQPRRRQPFTEWGLYFCVVLFLASAGLAIASRSSSWPQECFEISWNRLYVQVLDGEARFFSYPDYSNGQPVMPDTTLLYQPTPEDQRGSLTIPGFDFRYWFGWGEPVWSFRISLAIPAVLSLLASGLLLRRLLRKTGTARQENANG